MKLILSLSLACMVMPLIGDAAQTAQVRLTCGALHFEPGQSVSGAKLNVTSIAPDINGELAPVFDPDFSLTTAFYISNHLGGGVMVQGTLNLVVPQDDTNTNALPDFWETAFGVSLSNNMGAFTSSLGTGTVSAAWSRSMGSAAGDCQLTFHFDQSGDADTFTCPFSVIEYTGTLTYVPASNLVAGAMALSQTGKSTNTLQGGLQFSKPSPNPGGLLTLNAGSWTNAVGQNYSHPAFGLWRTVRSTIFNDAFEMADGDPQTPAADYQSWMLAIEDSNDYDADGIPDLADDLYSVPRVPVLTWLSPGTNQFLLLSGEVSRQHSIEAVTSLSDTNWQTVAAFTLNSDPQLLIPPPLTNSAMFWRAVAR